MPMEMSKVRSCGGSRTSKIPSDAATAARLISNQRSLINILPLPGWNMDYNKARRYVFLLPLHVIGLISIPNFYEHDWKNKLHRLVYRNFMWVGIIFGVLLQLTSTFIYSIHDLSEFLQRLLECLSDITILSTIFYYNVLMKEVIELLDLQEKEFKVSNIKIHKKYILQEQKFLAIAFLFSICVSTSFLIETILPKSERTLWLMTSLYHRKHPDRVLPFNMWTPSFIDASDMEYFVILYLLEVCLLVYFTAGVFEMAVMHIIFPISLKGQYTMLGEFVELMGVEHRDSVGDLIFYSDVATGEYLTETQMLHFVM